MAEELFSIIDKKIETYFRALVRLLKEYRRYEVKVLATLARQANEILQGRISSVDFKTFRPWKPMVAVKRWGIEPSFSEPYKFLISYPSEDSSEADAYFDTLDLYGYTLQEKKKTSDSTVHYDEYVLIPTSTTNEKIKIPKIPYLDWVSPPFTKALADLSKAHHLINMYVIRLPSSIQLEDSIKTICQIHEEDNYQYLYCRPNNPTFTAFPGAARYWQVDSDEYTIEVPIHVDSQTLYVLEDFQYNACIYDGITIGDVNGNVVAMLAAYLCMGIYGKLTVYYTGTTSNIVRNVPGYGFLAVLESDQADFLGVKLGGTMFTYKYKDNNRYFVGAGAEMLRHFQFHEAVVKKVSSS